MAFELIAQKPCGKRGQFDYPSTSSGTNWLLALKR